MANKDNEDKEAILTKKIGKWRAFVPDGLDMDKFGDKKDKIALILDRMYRASMYKNDYGFTGKRKKFTEEVSISTKRLVETLHEASAPLLDMICYSKRHKENGTEPIERVIVRVKSKIQGKRAAQYRLAKEYRVKPKIHRLQRTKKPVFSYDNEVNDDTIAGWLKAGYSESYKTVCEHIKCLTLGIDEQECKALIERIRDEYIQEDKAAYIKEKVSELVKKYPKDVAMDKATASWEKKSEERIKELNEKNYDSLLFIEDKVLEMKDRDTMPIYSRDDYGRLHYYLTNMPEELRPYIRLNGCKVMSYDLKTSQPVFIWTALKDYIKEHNITFEDIKKQADEIIEVIKKCSDGHVPDFVLNGIATLKRKRKEGTIEKEMIEFGKVLGKDFYEDIMKTIEWKRLSDGKFDRKSFKNKVLFGFLYGTMPNWSEKSGQKTIMHYFFDRFPSLYCILWRMRQFSDICLDYHKKIKKGKHPLYVLKHIKETYKTADFPTDMQRREARMFFNEILPKIDIPCITLHDSIIVESGKGSNVAKIIKQAFFDVHGIEVKVTCEHWHKKGGRKKKG